MCNGSTYSSTVVGFVLGKPVRRFDGMAMRLATLDSGFRSRLLHGHPSDQADWSSAFDWSMRA